MISTKRRMYVERYNLTVLNAVCESKVMLLNMAPPPLLTPNIFTRYHLFVDCTSAYNLHYSNPENSWKTISFTLTNYLYRLIDNTIQSAGFENLLFICMEKLQNVCVYMRL